MMLAFRKVPTLFGSGTETYLAMTGRYSFIILKDMGLWTVSYRLRNPSGPVSASSTIMGPFETFEAAALAAGEKWKELKFFS